MRASLARLFPLTWLPLLSAATPDANTFDVSVPAGANFARAAFRLWVPAAHARVRAVVVLLPGSNGDGRTLVNDPAWQAFAAQTGCALLGGELVDHPHPQPFIEDYSAAAQGSGAALLAALSQLAAATKRPELARAPLLLWGFSAGGQFSYELAAWQPARVAAFVVNKGGVYYTALTSAATRAVPALFFMGERDLPSRRLIVEGLFALNRRAGALWALLDEPGIGHEIGRSAELARVFFEDVLALRVSAKGELQPVPASSGISVEVPSHPQPRAAAARPETTSAWLPGERIHRAWRELLAPPP